MIKRISFIMLSLFLSTSIIAQDKGVGIFDDGEELFSRDYTIAVGAKAGISYTSMSDPDNFELDQKSGMGLTAGIAANFHFGRRTEASRGGTGLWGIQVEALFNQKIVKTNDEDLKFNYFELPVLAQCYLTPNLYIEAGPTFCSAISVSPDRVYLDKISIATGDIKGFDVAMSIGAGYKHKSGFMANARYNIGTSELAKNFTGKLSSFSISVGWLFTIIK